MMREKKLVKKMLNTIQETANKVWPAMYGTYYYKDLATILHKDDDDNMTYADAETAQRCLRVMCIGTGVNYYNLLMGVYQ